MSLTTTRRSLRHWPAWLTLCLALLLPIVPINAAPAVGVSRTQGAQSDAAAFNANPNVIAGVDGSGNVQALLTDTSGRIVLGASGAASQVEGEVSDGTATTGVNPVLIGLNNNSNVSSVGGFVTVGDGNSGARTLAVANYVASAAATVDRMRTANFADGTTGTGLLGCGGMLFDGTNWQQAAGDTTGTARVGHWRTAFKSTPTVGTGTAYAAGDVVGVLNTLTNAVRISGGNGVIRSVTVSNKSGVADPAIALRAWFFDSNPSGSTFTDNAALNIVDADITKVIGFVDLPGTGGTATGAEVWCNKSIDLHAVASGSANLFMVLESRGAVAANAGTTDWQITTVIEQD